LPLLLLHGHEVMLRHHSEGSEPPPPLLPHGRARHRRSSPIGTGHRHRCSPRTDARAHSATTRRALCRHRPCSSRIDARSCAAAAAHHPPGEGVRHPCSSRTDARPRTATAHAPPPPPARMRGRASLLSSSRCLLLCGSDRRLAMVARLKHTVKEGKKDFGEEGSDHRGSHVNESSL
jgi:hypothetical protein